jgi:hypothetical protein
VMGDSIKKRAISGTLFVPEYKKQRILYRILCFLLKP